MAEVAPHYGAQTKARKAALDILFMAEQRDAGLSDLEILDTVHAVALFAWANRLMLNLGEAVYP